VECRPCRIGASLFLNPPLLPCPAVLRLREASPTVAFRGHILAHRAQGSRAHLAADGRLNRDLNMWRGIRSLSLFSTSHGPRISARFTVTMVLERIQRFRPSPELDILTSDPRVADQSGSERGIALVNRFRAGHKKCKDDFVQRKVHRPPWPRCPHSQRQSASRGGPEQSFSTSTTKIFHRGHKG